MIGRVVLRESPFDETDPLTSVKYVDNTAISFLGRR